MNKTSSQIPDVIGMNLNLELTKTVICTFCHYNELNFSSFCENLTETFCDSAVNSTLDIVIPYAKRPETYVVPVIFFLIFILGIFGNGTLVMIFIRHKHMRNVPNTHILSLALADLLVITSSVPFTSIIYTMESWPWGRLICRISEASKDFSVAVSVFTLTALSADRYFAIVAPLRKFHTGGGTRSAKRITIITAVLIWVTALLIALPTAIGSHIKSIPDEEHELFHVCYPFPSHWMNDNYPRIMILVKFFILYIIPLSVIGFFYKSIAVFLLRSTKNMPGEVEGLQKQIKARKKVAVIVLIFVAIFFVSFAPMHIFMLFFYFHPNFDEMYNAFWHYFRIMGFCLAYINYCANPVALYIVSGAFRKYFNHYLACRKLTISRRDTYPNQETSISMVSVKRRNDAHVASINSPLIQETAISSLKNGQV